MAPPEATSKLAIIADPKVPLRWTRRTYRTSPGGVEADRCCKQPGSRQLGYTNIIGPGETTRKVVSLPAGRYWLYCNVDGHWQGGMISRLIVQ